MRRGFLPILSLFLLLPMGLGSAGQGERGILERKWDYKIQERVYLGSPSGWISRLPWLISSPALDDLGYGGPDLEVLTGTEEASGEWFPRGGNRGRYLALDSKGAHLWDYETNNNAGRASPAIVDLDRDGTAECIGGSTSGWMVHCFNRHGRRLWRFECARNQNVLAAPAIADLTGSAGLETVAVAAEGTVYCVSAGGRRIWQNQPGGPQTRRRGRRLSYAGASPAISDLNGDGRPEVVVNVIEDINARAYCLDGATGAVRWASEPSPTPLNTTMSGAAILPRADPCWQQPHLGRDASKTRVYVGTGNIMRCLAGASGKEVWQAPGTAPIVSSPAIGDVDGDGAPEVVYGQGRELICLNAYSGKVEWTYTTAGNVYSSPALASRLRKDPFRRDWPMFRHDPRRTGFYGHVRGPLAIYVGSDDGNLHVVDGRTGHGIDKYSVRFPDLLIVRKNKGPLKFMSSPSLADIDGNGTLEAVFTLVDRVWCIEDRESAREPEPRPESTPVRGQLEAVKKNTASPRNAFALAQLVHTGGWNPKLPVPEKMLEELSRRAKLDVLPEMAPLSILDDDLVRYPFLFVTGHGEVRLTQEETRKLKGHLRRGGFLFAEACCNADGFVRSMRLLAAKMFGEGKLAPLGEGHPIFNKVFTVESVKLAAGQTAPQFEGVEVDGRTAFILTPQDYACSWGNARCTSGCKGVASEDSYRMLTNIVVYALTE